MFRRRGSSRVTGVLSVLVAVLVAACGGRSGSQAVPDTAEPDQEAPAACEGPVVFADPKVEAAVRGGWFEPDEVLSRENLTRVGNLYAEGVASLEGVQCLHALRSLAVIDGSVRDIGPLAALTELSWVTLSGNAVEDISPLAGLTELRVVELERNRITDLSALAGRAAMYDLKVSGNAISSLESLRGLHVFNLSASNNSITDLEPLSGMKSLQWIELAQNQISDVTVLASFSQLEYLDLGANRLTDLTGLGASLPFLAKLQVNDNALTDLRPLSGFPALRQVNADRNQVRSLDGVTLPAPSCSSLSLAYNAVGAEDVSAICAKGWHVRYGDPPQDCNAPCP